jgi:hypothetical protein
MSLKNKYKVVKKLTGSPEENKLYSNTISVDTEDTCDNAIIMKCTKMINDDKFYFYLDHFDGAKIKPIFDGQPLWEVELITTPEESDDNKSKDTYKKVWTIDLGQFPTIKFNSQSAELQSVNSNDIDKLTFPCVMKVSDDNENFKIKTVVAYSNSKFSFPWIVCNDNGNDINAAYFTGYKFAKPITDDEFVYLTLQDISNGKGTGINPSLIRIKE